MDTVLYSSQWLFDRCAMEVRRPKADLLVTPDLWWTFLTEAQQYWQRVAATMVPHSQMGDWVKLTSADNGLSYTFGLDEAGRNIVPIGEVVVRDGPGATGRVLAPGEPWHEHRRFYIEADRIRWGSGKARTFADGPYAKFVTPAGVLDADHEPVFMPPSARMLLVHHAVEAAFMGPLKRDPSGPRDAQRRIWLGDPDSGEPGLLATLRNQFYGQGQQALDRSSGRWWPVDDGAGYTKYVP